MHFNKLNFIIFTPTAFTIIIFLNILVQNMN